MKNIIFLIGSPRKNGNTAIMCDLLLNKLSQGTVKFQLVNLNTLNFSGCTDCRACKTGDLKCTLNDDLRNYYPAIEAADLLVFGTPIYWYGPTAQMKALMDRLRPYYGNKLLKGKKAVVLLPAGVGSSDCDLTTEQFKRMSKALGIDIIKTITAKAYDIGEVLNDKAALEEIESLELL